MPRTKQPLHQKQSSESFVSDDSLSNSSSISHGHHHQLFFHPNNTLLQTPTKNCSNSDDSIEFFEASEALLLLGSGGKNGGTNGSVGSSASSSSKGVMSVNRTPVDQLIPRYTPPNYPPKKPDAKRKLDLDAYPPNNKKSPQAPSSAGSSSSKKTRLDSSLSALTKRFVTLIPPGGGSLDLNSAARSLGVQKRRIYDITNVLEGIGVLQKKSKNNIQWSDKLSSSTSTSQHSLDKTQLTHQINVLQRREDFLDNLMKNLETSLKSITDDKRWGYLTHADIRSIEEYKDMTLLLIKAPPSTSLTVPPREEGLQMHLKSEGGEIGVYLCPDQNSCGQKDVKEEVGGGGVVGDCGGENSSSSSSNRINEFDMALEKFMELSDEVIQDDDNGENDTEPKQNISNSLYSFALGQDEGLTNLFLC